LARKTATNKPAAISRSSASISGLERMSAVVYHPLRSRRKSPTSLPD
jgi:hypothetical protein